MAAGGWNHNNRAIRRILADVRELQMDPSDQYAARPMEDNMFDWHFSIRGPVGTDFEGGLYHGRIILPPDYPFKPPSIMLLTPNGRWEVSKKICLSISAYHPEQWQPAWGIRTILEALISFMTAPADGAVGALEFSSAERKRLARESLKYAHPNMPQVAAVGSLGNNASKKKYQDEIAKMHIVSLEPEDSSKDGKDAVTSAGGGAQASSTIAPAPAPAPEHTSESAQVEAAPVAAPVAAPALASVPVPVPVPVPAAAPVQRNDTTPGGQVRRANAPVRRRRRDWLLYYAVALSVVILAILYRKLLRLRATTEF